MKAAAIVLTYNHQEFIAQAVTSALSQHVDGDYQVIVLDDCSTDRTHAILKGLQAIHADRLRVIRSPTNECSNRRVGALVRDCPAEYVAFLDGDDYWTSRFKVQKQIGFLELNRDCSGCFHNAFVLSADGRCESHLFNPEAQPLRTRLEDLFAGNAIAGCSPLIRGDALRELPPWFDEAPFGDWPLYIEAATHGDLGYISEPLAVYRVHERGLWSGATKRDQLDSVIQFLELVNRGLAYRHDAQIQPWLCRHLYEAALEAEQGNDAVRAASYLSRMLGAADAAIEDRLTHVGISADAIRTKLSVLQRSGEPDRA